MTPVTDPEVLAQLNAPQQQAAEPQPVTDPALLRQLNARDFGIDWARPVSEVRADIAKLPDADRPEALRQWADAFVARERAPLRERGQRSADDIVRLTSRGTIAGPWLDEANALTSSALHTVTGGMAGAPYDEAVAYQRAVDRAIDNEYGWAGTGLQVAGGLASGGAAYRTARALGLPSLAGTTLPRAVGLGATVGAVHGANAAAGNTEGTAEERLAAVPEGAAIGATVGAVLPPAIRLTGAALRPVYDYVSPTLARVAANVREIPRRIGIHASADGAVPDPVTPGAQAAAEQAAAVQALRGGATGADLRAGLAEAERASLYHGGGERGAPGASYAPNAVMAAELDPSLGRLAGSAARASPEAANRMAAVMRARQTGLTPGSAQDRRFIEEAGLPTREPFARPRADDEAAGQGERVLEAFRRSMLVSDKEHHQHLATGRRTADAIVEQAERDAVPAYGAAYKAGENLNMAQTLAPAVRRIETDIIANEDPGVQTLVRRLLERFTNARNLEQFDRIKRAQLDQRIARLLKNPMYYNANTARVLTQVKEALLGAVDDVGKGLDDGIGPLYAKARAEFSSRMEMVNAYEAGRKLFQTTSDDAVDQIAAMGGVREGARSGSVKMLQLGAWDSAREAMETMRTGADRLAIFDNPRARRILSYLIPRTETATGRTKIVGGAPATFSDRPQRFGRYVENEQKMIATRNEVTGNSKTAQRLADDAAYGPMTALEEFKNAFSSGGATAAGLKILERGLNKVLGMRQDTSVAIARMLFTADPVRRRQNVERIIARMDADRAQALARYLREHQAALAGAAARGATTAGGQ